MNRFTAMLTTMAFLSSASMGAQTMVITRGGSRPVRPAPSENFTGDARVEMLFEALDPSHASGGSVTFEPGARTAWHSHPSGQILIVTAGTGRVQRWGDPVEEIRSGDVVRIPAGQKHWHGASPQTSMTHIAITEHRDGAAVQWMEKVSDEQYNGASPSADVNNGKSVFYEFYTEEEKKEQPTKSNTGLFFFRGKPGAPFAVISPGGGFSYVGSVHEGFPYAVAISKHGYNAFVLRYRAGSGGTVATRDLAAAISYVFRNAKVLGVGTQGYSLWGSSAGARMAAIGSHGVGSFGGDDLPKPSAVVMAYTGHSEYSTNEPSTFVIVGEHDGIAPPSVMERRVAALRKAGTEVEFHRYSGLGHGFGPGAGTSAAGWLERALRFWERTISPSIRKSGCRVMA